MLLIPANKKLVTANKKQAYVFLDFETANRSWLSACQIGIVKMINGKIVAQFSSYINPVAKDFTFTYFHHISQETVKDAPNFQALWPQISDFFAEDCLIIAHNVNFDLTIFAALCDYFEIKVANFAYLCSVRILKKLFIYHKYKLSTLAQANNIIFNHHDAFEDALTLQKIFAVHFCNHYDLAKICLNNGINIGHFNN